jgi:beta-glucosidase-like glycosyl hydrolase
VKTGLCNSRQILQHLLREQWLKKGCFASDDDYDDDDERERSVTMPRNPVTRPYP